jgi:hypothetical protein
MDIRDLLYEWRLAERQRDDCREGSFDWECAELRVRRCREAFRAEVARAAARHEPYRPFPEPMNLMDSTASAT